MGGLIRLAAASLGLVSALVLSPTAIAQTAPPPPPIFTAVDSNGVDLASGRLQVSDVNASVGDLKDGGLARFYQGRWLRDNLTGGIDQGLDGKYVVSLGSTSGKFTRANASAPFVAELGSPGQTLTYNASANTYAWTLRDGTVATFAGAMASIYPLRASLAAVTTIVRPSGETLTYTYDDYDTGCSSPCKRVRAVTSNRGYMIKYEYAGTTLTTGSLALTRVLAINLFHEFCSATAATCSTTNTWSSSTFSYANVAPLTNTMTVTDSLSRATVYTLVGTASGTFTPESDLITKIVDPSGVTTDIGYNGNQQVMQVGRSGMTWTYAYTVLPGGNRQTTVTDLLGHTRVVVTTPDGAVVSETNGENRTTLYEVDAGSGLITKVTNPEGDYASYVYDGRGNLTSVTQVAKSGTGLPNRVTTAAYPTTCPAGQEKVCNKATSVTDAGETTDYTYAPAHGGVLTITRAPDPNGVRPQTRQSYVQLGATYYTSALGKILSSQKVWRPDTTKACMTLTLATCAGGGDETIVTHGWASLPTKTENLQLYRTTAYTGAVASAVTMFTYTKQGDLASADGPLTGGGDKSSWLYNSERELVGQIEIDPDGADVGRRAVAKKYQYRPDGQLEWMETGSVANDTASGWSGFAAEERVTLGYDGAGRKARETLRAGGVDRALTQYSYDVANRLECVAQRMNASVFGSPPASACTLGTEGSDGPDRIRRFTYDGADREVSVTDGYGTPDAAVVQATTYRPNGKVETLKDGNNNVTTNEYDGFDRLKRLNYPNPSGLGVDYEEYTYDATTWNMSQLRRRDGSLRNFAYDARHNLTWRNNPEAPYAYDNLDRLKSAAENGQSMSWTYDVLGRLISVNGIAGAVSYQYNAAGQRTRTTWPDAFYVTYDLDATGAVTAIRENGAGSGPGVLATFTYDDLGRRTGVSRGNGAVSTTYAYDPVSRLETLTLTLPDSNKNQSLSFTYNAAGQIKTRVSNNTAVYGWTGLYNAYREYAVNGLNQVTLSGASAVTHNARGNLTSDGATTYGYDGENRLASVSNGAALSYDPVGRLYQVTPGSGAGRRYAYDGADLIMEYAPSNGAVLRRYVYGPGDDEPLVAYEGSGTTDRRWLAADAQGSIIATAIGSTVVTNSYDEYGVPAAGNAGAFQYTGQLWIPEASVYNYKARAYHPTLGRFLQTDPIGYADGLNLYAYVGDDPVNQTDPDGTTRSGCQPSDLTTIIVCGAPPLPPPPAIAGISGVGPSGPLNTMSGIGPLTPTTAVMPPQGNPAGKSKKDSWQCKAWRLGDGMGKGSKFMRYVGIAQVGTAAVMYAAGAATDTNLPEYIGHANMIASTVSFGVSGALGAGENALKLLSGDVASAGAAVNNKMVAGRLPKGSPEVVKEGVDEAMSRGQDKLHSKLGIDQNPCK